MSHTLRILAAALTAAVLTGCGADPTVAAAETDGPDTGTVQVTEAQPSPAHGSYFYADDIVLPDDTTVQCVSFRRGHGGGVSCNWDRYNAEHGHGAYAPPR